MNKELVNKLIDNAETGRYSGGDYIEAAARIKVLETALIELRKRYSNSPWIVEQVNSVLFT